MVKLSPNPVAFDDDLATGFRAAQAVVLACRAFSVAQTID